MVLVLVFISYMICNILYKEFQFHPCRHVMLVVLLLDAFFSQQRWYIHG